MLCPRVWAVTSYCPPRPGLMPGVQSQLGDHQDAPVHRQPHGEQHTGNGDSSPEALHGEAGGIGGAIQLGA